MNTKEKAGLISEEMSDSFISALENTNLNAWMSIGNDLEVPIEIEIAHFHGKDYIRQKDYLNLSDPGWDKI